MDDNDLIPLAIPDERGCGFREEDGVYAECGLSPFGSPVESFVLDPPIPIPPDLQINPLGVTMIKWGDTYHLVDWVGAEHYPLPPNLDWGKLTKESRILLVHGKAGINNPEHYPEREHVCPKGVHQPGEPCAGMWWEDLTGGKESIEPGKVTRSMPSFQYEGKPRPDHVTPDYRPMFFARFPISRFAVVKGEKAEGIAAKIKETGTPLPVQLADK